MKTETPHEAAERITQSVAMICGCAWESCTVIYSNTVEAIEAALNAERVRALSDAACQECVFCAGVEGYNPLPVEAKDSYVHNDDPPHGLAGVYCKAPRIRALITATKDSR